MTTWRVTIAASPALQPLLTETLASEADSLTLMTQTGEVEMLTRQEPDRPLLQAKLALLAAINGQAAPPLRIETLPEIDWLLKVASDHPPRRIGRFFVHAAHQRLLRPLGARHALEIEATTAFGTGEHPTTASCLRFIDKLSRRNPGKVRRALDLGCGTGILGFGIAKAFPRARIRLTDNDPEATRVAVKQARVNGLHRRLQVKTGAGLRRSLIGARPYDLLVSNLFLRPLLALAPEMRSCLKPGGTLILSGILVTQERRLLQKLLALGFRLQARQHKRGWSALRLKKS